MKKKYFLLFAVFFFNPVISIIDFLPDFLAYLFLLKAIIYPSFVFDKVEDAFYYIKKMMFISVAKCLCVFLLPLTDNTMALVFSFSFGILELVFGISAFIKLFDSLGYIEERTGNFEMSQKCVNIKKLTVLLFVFRSIIAFLPDVTALSLPNQNNGEIILTYFRPLLMMFSFVIQLIVGIIWLVKFISFCSSFLKSENIDKIEEDVLKIKEEKKAVFYAKNNIFVISLILFASVFVFNFSLSGVNVLLNGIFLIVSSATVMYLYKSKYICIGLKERMLYIVSILCFIASLLQSIFEYRYLKEYDESSARYIERASRMYLPVEVFSVLNAVFLFSGILILLFIICNYIKEAAFKNREFFPEYNATAEELDYFIRKNKIRVMVFSALNLVISVLSVFLIPYAEIFFVLKPITEIVFIFVFFRFGFYLIDSVFKKILKYA